jgi:hypothetical protein
VKNWANTKHWIHCHTYEACDLLVEGCSFRELLREHCETEHAPVEELDLGDAFVYRYENGAVAMHACDRYYFGLFSGKHEEKEIGMGIILTETPRRKDLTDRECCSLLGSTIGGLIENSSVENVVRALQWWAERPEAITCLADSLESLQRSALRKV